jgi:nucleotide-binding universal stress UspA family protein
MLYTQVLIGTPFIEVIRIVQRDGHDLLMKAAGMGEGTGAAGLVSTDMHLLRKCPCPVWIDHPASAYPYRRLLAAVDPTGAQAGDLNRLILDLATSLAEREGAGWDVVYAWRLPSEQVLRSEPSGITAAEVAALLVGTEGGHRAALDRLLAPYGKSAADPSVHLVAGEPATAIGATVEATGADLIVMGTIGGVCTPGLFIGRTAEDVLRTARTSVLAVKPAGFVSPVTLA